jgi:hypothetical protein
MPDDNQPPDDEEPMEVRMIPPWELLGVSFQTYVGLLPQPTLPAPFVRNTDLRDN